MESDFKRPDFQVKDMCIYKGNPIPERKVCRILGIKDSRTWTDKKVPEYKIVLLVEGKKMEVIETDLDEIR